MKQLLLFVFVIGFIIEAFTFSGYPVLLENRDLFKGNQFLTSLKFFNAILTNYNFDEYELDESIHYNNDFGVIFMLFFIVITAILLMNLIIAIITNIYNTLKEDSLGVYLDDIVRKRPLMLYDKYYSGMVSLPFPLNVISFPF